MKKRLVGLLVGLMLMVSLTFSGCAGKSTVPATVTGGNIATAVATHVGDVQTMAVLLDDVYGFLVQMKTVPNHTAAATKTLAALDQIAPVVKTSATNLSGDKFNWVSFVLQSALAVAQIMGYVVPLL